MGKRMVGRGGAGLVVDTSVWGNVVWWLLHTQLPPGVCKEGDLLWDRLRQQGKQVWQDSSWCVLRWFLSGEDWVTLYIWMMSFPIRLDIVLPLVQLQVAFS